MGTHEYCFGIVYGYTSKMLTLFASLIPLSVLNCSRLHYYIYRKKTIKLPSIKNSLSFGTAWEWLLHIFYNYYFNLYKDWQFCYALPFFFCFFNFYLFWKVIFIGNCMNFCLFLVNKMIPLWYTHHYIFVILLKLYIRIFFCLSFFCKNTKLDSNLTIFELLLIRIK